LLIFTGSIPLIIWSLGKVKTVRLQSHVELAPAE
jgi:hypothetical protein